jgi:hypothetical protein
MTSTESTFLGIIVGAALTWLIGVSTSRGQWKRDEWRRLTERRAELYQDAIREKARMSRQLNRALAGKPIASDLVTEEEDDERRAEWRARVALFASPQVSDLWTVWYDLYFERLDLADRRDNDDEVVEWKNRIEHAEGELVRRMRSELEPPGR